MRTKLYQFIKRRVQEAVEVSISSTTSNQVNFPQRHQPAESTSNTHKQLKPDTIPDVGIQKALLNPP